MKTPIVLIIFNRPHTTRRVFEMIRQVKPMQLFVIADGSRPDKKDEAEKCQMTRKILEGIDWDCQIFKNYSDVNLGCCDRVSSGLNWVFSHVNEAIILEDDCLPALSFFHFCEELLNYYRHDERIMMISGNNFQFGRRRTHYSYYFSRYPHTWGWATWKRAWQHYDANMQLWPMVKDSYWLKSILDNQKSIDYWNRLFQKTFEGDHSIWDYRWQLACWLQNGLAVLPNVNLVSNIGFDQQGTHTLDSDNFLANLPVEKMDDLIRHPPIIMRHYEADDFTQKLIFQPGLLERLKIKLKNLAKVRFKP